LIFVQLVDSRFAHLDDKAELIDDKNDDGNEADADIQNESTNDENDGEYLENDSLADDFRRFDDEATKEYHKF
jgi:hypothetical protein